MADYLPVQYVRDLVGLSWDTLDYLTKQLGRPTDGALAEAVWLKSNFDPKIERAIAAMERMGYVPFKGYPLTLRGDRAPDDKCRWLALENAKAEIDDNAYPAKVKEILNGERGLVPL